MSKEVKEQLSKEEEKQKGNESLDEEGEGTSEPVLDLLVRELARTRPRNHSRIFDRSADKVYNGLKKTFTFKNGGRGRSKSGRGVHIG